MRALKRSADELRPIEFIRNYTKHAEGSVLVKCGDTHVICNASIEENVPSFLKGKGHGWVTAEYGMLPRSTSSRMGRESSRGKQSGRTQEIQRLIGRSLRTVVDMKAMGELQVRIDCDVIQADGGTRTASITGAYVALYQAFQNCIKTGTMKKIPFTDEVAAISCGLYKGNGVLDLDYAEDSNAETDANFVLTGKGGIVEIQGTAEETPFSEKDFAELMRLAKKGIGELVLAQRKALGLA